VDPGARAAIRKLNMPSLLFDLSGRTGLLTDNIVIALVLGPAAVVPLFLTQRLPQLAQGQLQGVGNASWAALSDLHALGRHDVFTARLLELTRLVAALGVAVLLPIAAYNHVFVRLWVGDAHFGGTAVTVLAAVNALLLALVSLWGWCFSGTGQVALLVPVMLLSAALNISISVAAAFAIGIAGPLLGTTVAIASTTLWYLPLLLQRRFATPAAALARAVLAPLAWASVPGALVWWVSRVAPPAGWPGLAAHVAGAAALLLCVWWFFELRAGEREHYLARLRMALPGSR
jgi:O-antigen/teichoic acid export membrane protein